MFHSSWIWDGSDHRLCTCQYCLSCQKRQRLELMREMYHNEAEMSPTSPDYNVESLTGGDPFYDRFPWFRMVGRGFVYLSNLLYPVTLIHKVAIVSEKGDVRGYLRVAVQAVMDEDNSDQVGVRQSARIAFETPKAVIEHKNIHNMDERIIEGQNGIDPIKLDELIECDADSGRGDSSVSSDLKEDEIPDHLAIGKEFTFRVTVLQAVGISTEYADIFCQFNFLHRHDEAFSTEPVKNSGKGTPLGFYHVQNITVSTTKSFIDYIKTQPIVFEVFGHYQQHPLHKDAKLEGSVRQPPRRMLPPSIPISQPVRSSKFGALPSPCTAHIHAKVDVLVWFEICELAPSGEYVPVVVEHSDDLPCRGLFLLHQGIQRRIRITIVHDQAAEIKWRDVKELVVGRIRNSPESDEDEDNDNSVLSLGLFPGEYLEVPGDDRVMFRFEAAWDSSLHNSPLLNRVTSGREQIFMTISAYLELENCGRPAIITKDLSMVIYGRTGPSSFKRLFSGNYRNDEANRLSGVYELLLRRASEAGVQRRQRRVLDTSSTYVRGEENLHGWRPRGDSLIFDHQWELEKLTRLEEVEWMRHTLLLRERLGYDRSINHNKYHVEYTKSEKEVCNMVAKNNNLNNAVQNNDFYEYTDREKQLLIKCIRLIQGKGRDSVSGMKDNEVASPSEEMTEMSTSMLSSMMSNASIELCSPERAALPGECAPFPPVPVSPPGPRDPELVLYVPDMEEIRISPVVARKGYLNVLEHKTKGWKKRWVSVRRPYVFIFRDEKDPVERALINLGTAQVEYSEDQLAMVRLPNTFSVVSKHRGYLLQTLHEKEVHDWLYAINPLLAGQIRSKSARRNPQSRQENCDSVGNHQKNPPVIRLSEVKATHFPPPNSKTFHRPIATLLREHRIAKSRNSTANRYICCKPAVYSSVNRATVTPEDLCFDMTRLESVVLALAALCLTGQYQNDFPQDVSVGPADQNLPVTQQCLGCICEAISSCDTSGSCSGDVCGPFRLTWAYWADAGKPTVNNEAPDSNTAYGNCARDTYCSALAVQGYMQKFQQDCNNDGKIDCDDFAAIHKLGGYGCKGGLPGVYGQRYQQCKSLLLLVKIPFLLLIPNDGCLRKGDEQDLLEDIEDVILRPGVTYQSLLEGRKRTKIPWNMWKRLLKRIRKLHYVGYQRKQTYLLDYEKDPEKMVYICMPACMSFCYQKCSHKWPHSNSCGAVTTNISYPVTPKCLSCMCEAMSSCDTNGSCTGNVCGLFKITWGYWVEGGKHTVNNESSESAFAHTHCTIDTYCSLLTVQGYMQNFQQDCNDDKKIDCDDFLIIHYVGGYGCQGGKLPEDKWMKATFKFFVACARPCLCATPTGGALGTCVVFLKSPGRIGLAEGGTLNESSESDSAHAHCTLDTYCSLLTVQGYMQNFQQDCNGDEKIDCDDFLIIHNIGGWACQGEKLPEDKWMKYSCGIKISGTIVNVMI
ncbi:hypothetical protein GEV33_002777 [Tenebrio molitor]|uniref:lysozyme n=1 Tax=Tenebrio molitor TaxID=7067 RepID=A0A8J6LID6_TENMO|nr:hypothetical protein GEV33_002777 [Tenebrio molitor]